MPRASFLYLGIFAFWSMFAFVLYYVSEFPPPLFLFSPPAYVDSSTTNALWTLSLVRPPPRPCRCPGAPKRRRRQPQHQSTNRNKPEYKTTKPEHTAGRNKQPPLATENLLEDTDGCGSPLLLLTCALLMTSSHSEGLRQQHPLPRIIARCQHHRPAV